ncbi:MAG: hypothetical protein JO340_00935 [Acidobacteriaceae bacterium]|nr:hypothetical protein [Acidobacteriaceae bacterium]
MTRFEEQLKEAMARREPSGDFTARVLAKANREAAGGAGNSWRDWFRAPMAWRFAGAAACAVLLATSGSVMYEQHERAARGEAAKDKLMTAVRIAGVKLQQVHRHVLQVEAMEANQ